MYGILDNVCLLTLAPEIPNAMSVINELCKRNIKVSVGKFIKISCTLFEFILHYTYFRSFIYFSDFDIIIAGHSIASLNEGEAAVKHGATFITHLFNAMLPVNILNLIYIIILFNNLLNIISYSSTIVIQD